MDTEFMNLSMEEQYAISLKREKEINKMLADNLSRISSENSKMRSAIDRISEITYMVGR